MSSLEEYIVSLESADETERTFAAEDIGYLNTPDGVPALLIRLIKEPSSAVRDAIYQALIRIDADEAIAGSIALLDNDDTQIRNQAVDVLRRKGAGAIPYLTKAMQTGDKDLRKLVLDTLNGVQTSGAEPIYDAALNDQDANIVITAVESLGRVQAERYRSRIEALLQSSSNPMLTGVCLEALSAIGNALSLVSIRGRFPALSQVPDFLLMSCLKALGALGTAAEFVEIAGLLAVRGPHLHPAILGALVAIHQRDPASTFGENLLPALQALIEEGESPLCRYQAVRALGSLSLHDDAFSFLVSSLESSERMVRLGAVESLRLMERPGLEGVLAQRALTETDQEVLQALKG